MSIERENVCLKRFSIKLKMYPTVHNTSSHSINLNLYTRLLILLNIVAKYIVPISLFKKKETHICHVLVCRCVEKFIET